jgi:hypothetical protein
MLERKIELISRGSDTLRPPLPIWLAHELSQIEPSPHTDRAAIPCAATLADGRILECVMFEEQSAYMKGALIYPKNEIRIADIVRIRPSPFRMPAQFAKVLYEAGESGMGYVVFTIVFEDGSTQAYTTGNSLDFVEYPHGKSGADIRQVLPHTGRRAAMLSSRKSERCLFSNDQTLIAMQRGLLKPVPIGRLSLIEWLKYRKRRWQRRNSRERAERLRG